jgi:hypothetical protein
VARSYRSLIKSVRHVESKKIYLNIKLLPLQAYMEGGTTSKVMKMITFLRLHVPDLEQGKASCRVSDGNFKEIY